MGQTWAEIRRFWQESRLEVIVMVEGIDAVTSDTTQARHSYCVDDLQWNMELGPCVRPDDEGRPVVDFEHFHDVIPAAQIVVES